jgi:hypothetical protein
MKKFIIFAIACALTMLSIGCNKMAPKCDSAKAKNLVLETAWGQTISSWSFFGASEEDVRDMFDLDIEDIRTTETNKETGKYVCEANLVVESKEDDSTEKLPIKYTIGNADDGKPYVEISGLM